MMADSDDFRLLNHFTILAYPFIHNISSLHRRRLELLAESWEPGWARLNDQQLVGMLDSTYFFLPYIREVLFPETQLVSDVPTDDGYCGAVKKLKMYSQKGLTFAYSGIPSDVTLRLTYRKELLAKMNSFVVTPSDASGHLLPDHLQLSARLEWVDAILFSSGIGFLILKVVLDNQPSLLSELIDLNYHLRMVHPPSVGWNLPTLDFMTSKKNIRTRDLLDFLAQGLVNDDAIVSDIFQYREKLKGGTQTRYSETEAGQVYGERCHNLSYGCIHPTGEIKDSPVTGFSDLKDRLLFEFASSIQLGRSISDPMWTPALPQVSELLSKNRFSFWRCWRGMALKESVVFLGTEDIDFNNKVLPHNIEYNYLPLYIYTLHQKYKLFAFSDELMRKGMYVQHSRPRLRALMDRFIKFRNRYWFNEVTRKPLGSELYRKFQEGLEIPTLYELVSNEVKDVKEYYEEQHEQRIRTLLSILTFVFLPLGVVVGVFGMTFFNGSWRGFTITCLVVGAISLGVWKWWTQEWQPKDDL